MTEHVRVAVIGGGIVGCSVLFALAERGWTDTLLLERRELTSGSTWHAAGNTTFFGHYVSITRLYVESVAAYLRAEDESGQAISFHAAGSLRLATTPAELDAYRSLEPMYQAMGVPYHVIGPTEIEAVHPLLNTAGLFGAAHTPTDGHVDSSGATHALAQAARKRGAKIKRQCPVETIAPHKEGWRLGTPEGEVIAEHIVLANSFWAREMAEQIGLNLPLYPLQHHELITDAIPELAALDFEVPTVRDPWAPSNTRQEGHGFLCGVYEAKPEFWATDGIPPDFAEELLPPDTQRLERHLLKVIERMPAFGRAGIKTVNNGPICYAPDGCPLLGPVVDHPGLWLATGFPVGIGTGGGSGAFLADWMVNGEEPYGLPIVHPARFPNDLTREACLAQIAETYRQGYGTPEPA
ncbi:MAG: FAD-binding oxidoreductase [Alphaproteobacteria bacterium]|jgi:glycine/D-amino acid oxidase-like deaminating enzyme|nr:FAD-binding oxidoreductase [Rhodospirillaceae bacterium]MBT7613170.1 FAD-binding oxidoreductase [Rhodospirillaceae bacterium]MDG2480406.1 FAD-binding oxidoreductase [Alphaproteobacteria bacterium]